MIPRDGRYRIPNGLADELTTEWKHLQNVLQWIQSERRTIEQEYKKLKRMTVKTYTEAVEASHTIPIKT